MEQILFWLAGGLGVPMVNALKSLLGLEGKAAMWLTAPVAALLGCAAVLLTKGFSLSSLTPEQLFAAFGQVLAAATLAYKLLASNAPGAPLPE
jgi:hypothetical protein